MLFQVIAEGNFCWSNGLISVNQREKFRIKGHVGFCIVNMKQLTPILSPPDIGLYRGNFNKDGLALFYKMSALSNKITTELMDIKNEIVGVKNILIKSFKGIKIFFP